MWCFLPIVNDPFTLIKLLLTIVEVVIVVQHYPLWRSGFPCGTGECQTVQLFAIQIFFNLLKFHLALPLSMLICLVSMIRITHVT